MKGLNIEQLISQMTLEEKAQMCSGRDFWDTQNIDRLAIPSLMMCDGPNGLRKQLVEQGFDHMGINKSIETVCYPTSSAMASSFDLDLLYELGETLGEECQSEDVAMLLGPGVNMKRSPLCGRNFEYFSEDPYLSGKLAAAYIQGLQSKGVAACVKHFAANNQETNRMSGNANIDERTLHEIYLPAFETAVKEGKVRSVMSAYNSVNGEFASQNRELLTDILRDKWNYKGLVVSDWGGVKERTRGLEAGNDLEMPGAMVGKHENIIAAVESGELDEKYLDQAVRNILTFVSDSLEFKKATTFDQNAAREKSLKFAKESAVLLKNENNILPLKVSDKVAFIGEFAKVPRYQGAGSSYINVPHPISALEALSKEQVSYAQGFHINGKEDQVLLDEAVALAKKSDVVVIFAGIPQTFEVEGLDRKNLEMPNNQNQLINAISAVHDKVIVVLHTGGVLNLPWLSNVQGVLNMYLAGDSVGKATVDLLYGYANPSGKLAETWPLQLADNPSYLNFPGERGNVDYKEGIYIGYRYYDKKNMDVLFPFGYGLSYSKFDYGQLTLDKTSMTDNDTLTLSLKVKNVGERAGKEIVQLYIKDQESTVHRPEKELRAFKKIQLEAGQEKEVKFTLNKRDFAYYEPLIHDWYVETGKFTILVGASSRDIKSEAEVYIKTDQMLPTKITRYSSVQDVFNIPYGKEKFDILLAKYVPQTSQNPEQDTLGGDSNQNAEMTLGMPLYSFYTFGILTLKELDEFVIDLNRFEK